MSKEQPHIAVEEIIASLTEVPGSANESPVTENRTEAISKIAYGYWETRGAAGGDPLEDWVRAEEEYSRRLTAV